MTLLGGTMHRPACPSSGGYVERSIPARVLPRRLLHDPVVVQALATRTFSVVFTAAKSAGRSFNANATATGMKPERVSLVARGAAAITAMDTIERIADGLHIPGEMLGLAARCWETGSAENAVPGRENKSMQRRQLLRGALAGGLTTTSRGLIADVLTQADHALAVKGPAGLARQEAV